MSLKYGDDEDGRQAALIITGQILRASGGTAMPW